MRTQGLRNDILGTWVRRRGFGYQTREVLYDMSTGCQHEGMGDDERRTLFDASTERVSNRRLGKLHVGDFDDSSVVHSGPHHLGDTLDQLVRLGASAAMVDQENRVLLAHES